MQEFGAAAQRSERVDLVGSFDPELDASPAGAAMRQHEQGHEFGVGGLTAGEIKLDALDPLTDLALHQPMKALNPLGLDEVAGKASNTQRIADSRHFGPRRPRPAIGLCKPHRPTPLGPAPP
jgi:hypothetical protein